MQNLSGVDCFADRRGMHGEDVYFGRKEKDNVYCKHNMSVHALNEIRPDGSVINYPSEGNIRASMRTVLVETDADGVNIYRTEYGAPEGIPEKYGEDDRFIVSALAAASIKEYLPEFAPYCWTVSGPIRDSNGRIIGCSGFAVVE